LKSVVVCADDFGIDAPVSAAIIELLEAQCISAVSVLVFAPDTARAVPDLQVRHAAHSIGMHFTLTEFSRWSAAKSLPWLVMRSGLRLVPPGRVRETFLRQLDRFEELFSRPPDFVDGHGHVHQLAVVRDVVVDSLCERYGSSVAVRSACTREPSNRKARLIASLGGCALAKLARRRGLTTNTDFAGAYRFNRTGRYRERLVGWVAGLADGGLIMCHPGTDPSAGPIAPARYEEYRYLRSPEWLADLQAQSARLVPFRNG
jgi:predicted glycoside hydrolase/deacetylase ChbG (UPF0249 family)